MKLGVCYYPEHWPQERWALDAKLMRDAGLSLVRIAEFAWALMEPREGEFHWDWLDRAVETLASEELEVILGTPTASPPPWLVRANPEVLPVDSQGRRRQAGSRRHYCVASPSYLRHTERIVEAMASRYGNHSAVAGWQIDNEFGWGGTTRCYCGASSAAFRRWLEAKYGTIQNLNEAWGTVFWSQIYNDWGEIDLPNLTVGEPNPSHVLDFYRFSSDMYVAYQQLQLSTLQLLISERQFVTTNYMSQFTDLDYHDLAEPLDLVSMSSYPTGHAESASFFYSPQEKRPDYAYDVGDPYITGIAHALMRGFKLNRPFWVMEQQCGNVNWSSYNTGVRPGTVRLWTWHALASGADAVVYFRWRAGLYAQEQYHSGLLRHDGSTAVGYSDLEEMAEERALMAEIAAEPHQAQVALLMDYDSVWAVQLQPHHRDFDTMRHLFVYYRALQRLGLPSDILSYGADLSAYKLIIVPAALLGTVELAASLTRFAEAGGTVLLGVRSGSKTTSNQFTDQPLPGVFRDIAGVTVRDWHALPPSTSYDFSATIPGLLGPAMIWAESLLPTIPDPLVGEHESQVLAHYISGPFKAHAAFTEHRVGAGRVLYLGWYPTEPQAAALLAYLVDRAGVDSHASVPNGLIISQRGPYRILLNFTDAPLTATLGGQPVVIPPRDVEVF